MLVILEPNDVFGVNHIKSWLLWHLVDPGLEDKLIQEFVMM
jgi:hypothetical protein